MRWSGDWHTLTNAEQIKQACEEGTAFGKFDGLFCVRFREDGEGTLGELTEEGSRFLELPTTKYPRGIVLETSDGKLLAGCKTMADAAKLVGKHKDAMKVVVDRPPSDPLHGIVRTMVRTTGGGFKGIKTVCRARKMRDDDNLVRVLRVTKRGRRVLPGWSEDIGIEYLR